MTITLKAISVPPGSAHFKLGTAVLVACLPALVLLSLQNGAQDSSLPDDFVSKPELFPFWRAGISGQGQASHIAQHAMLLFALAVALAGTLMYVSKPQQYQPTA